MPRSQSEMQQRMLETKEQLSKIEQEISLALKSIKNYHDTPLLSHLHLLHATHKAKLGELEWCIEKTYSDDEC
ncbi:MAG: hypothetical protein JWO44_2638 [Bacteroidetes bacterium]|nr:hypothetical protein [Bacteroidota bacterium]